MFRFGDIAIPKTRKSLIKLRNLKTVQAAKLPDPDLTVPGSEHASSDRGERLKQAVRSVGPAKLVAEKAGIPLGTLNAYLAGREMKLSNAAALALATNVSMEWLATGRGSMRPGMAETSHEFHGVLQRADVISAQQALLRPTPGTVLISRYDARAAAGVPVLRGDTAVIEKIAFSESWIRTVLRRNPEHLALMESSGDSMFPTIADGDVIMVDLSVNEVHSARIYVLDLDGALIVKRVQRLFDGSFKIISDNTRYDTEIVRPSERNPLRVVGEVVWHAGLMRS